MLIHEVDRIIQGDCFDCVKALPDRCVNLVITSPPYFRQRVYTDHRKELGQESSVAAYVDRLLAIFLECLRVVRDDGSVVFNVGDKYIDGGLQLIPYQFALAASKKALLVNNVSWTKSNPTPRQCRRRLVSSHEPFFHFAKSDDYYYRLPDDRPVRGSRQVKQTSRYHELIERSSLSEEQKRRARADLDLVMGEVARGELLSFRMKIKDVHSMPYGGYEGGRKTQILNNGYTVIRVYGRKMQKDVFESPIDIVKWKKHPAVYPQQIVERFLGILTRENDVVLDPFMGSGTTAMACKKTNRRYLGIELCEEFVERSRKRLGE